MPRVIFLFPSKIQLIDLFTKAEDIPYIHSTRNRTGQYTDWKLPLKDEAVSRKGIGFLIGPIQFNSIL
jgi:hypothetical protein